MVELVINMKYKRNIALCILKDQIVMPIKTKRKIYEMYEKKNAQIDNANHRSKQLELASGK